MAPAVNRVEQRPGLRHGDHADEESLTLADVQFDRVPTPSLMLGEVLERRAPGCGNLIQKCNGTRRGTGTDRLRVASAVMRLTRATACGRLVPAEHLIVEICVAVANLVIILRPANVTLNLKVLLPKLVDQARKRPMQTIFHACPQRAKALRVGLIFLKNGCQTCIPLAQRLFLRVGNFAQVGFHSRPASRRQHTDMILLAHIEEQSRLSLCSYDRPRMTEELQEVGIDVGHREKTQIQSDHR